MGGYSLDGEVVTFGYSCPWCPTLVVEVVGYEGSAVGVFEQHLDTHFVIPVTGPEVAARITRGAA